MIVRIAVVALVVIALAVARKSKPAGNKRGQQLIDSPKQDHQPALLTVATFNIQTGKNLQGQRNLQASADVLKGADLVGVQEVYAPSLVNLLGGGMSQTEKLAKTGGFGWLFCATRRRWLREHRGNALLSKLYVNDWRVEMLPDQSNKSFRNMTVAQVHWQGESFHFINTHLHTRGGREEQLEIVLREFAKYPRAILVGDFNTTISSDLLRDALKDIEVTDAVASVGLDKDNADRIDWILTKGFTVESGNMLEKGVSDHPYYQVKLSYKVG